MIYEITEDQSVRCHFTHLTCNDNYNDQYAVLPYNPEVYSLVEWQPELYDSFEWLVNKLMVVSKKGRFANVKKYS